MEASGNYWADGCWHHNSGKTYGLAADIFRHIFWNAGAKAVVARHTETSNVATSIDTFKQFFEDMGSGFNEDGSNGLFKLWANPNKFRVPSRLAIERMQAEKDAGRLKTKSERLAWIDAVGDRLCGTIEFKGLPDITTGESKLRGMECSYLALVEADQIERRFFDLSFACLRWKGADPSTCDAKGYIVDKSLVLDTNPPGNSHWIAQLERDQRLLPPASRMMSFWHIPTDENAANLPPNYIRDQIMLPYANNPAMIDRMRYGKYADAFDGKPVFYAYRTEHHEYNKPDRMSWPHGAILGVGMDVGTNNASVICAIKTFGIHQYLWALREIILTGSDTDRQCLVLLETLAREYPWWNGSNPLYPREVCPETRFFCDPAARNSAFTKSGPTASALAVMQSHGIFPGMKTGLNIQPKVATCNRLLQQFHLNESGEAVYHFRIDSQRCPTLTRGLAGLLRYPAQGEPGFGDDKPLKGDLVEHVDHVCFVAGTMVQTPTGERSIESLRVGDLVLTRNGARRVESAFNRMAPVREFQFSNGTKTISTDDHPYWSETKRAMIPVALLTHEDTLISCKPIQKKLSSVGRFIDATLTRLDAATAFISRTTRRICTTLFGRRRMVPDQRECTSTIGTGIPQTIASTISNCSRQNSTSETFTPLQSERELRQEFLMRFDLLPQPGMVRPKVTSGIAAMPWIRDLGSSCKRSGNAIIAVTNTHSNQQPESSNERDSVQIIAARHGVARLVWTSWIAFVNFATRRFGSIDTCRQNAVHVVAASASANERRVFNVTVEGEHEYFANGLLVSNCDGFAYLVNNALAIAEEPHTGSMRSARDESRFTEPQRRV